RAQDLEAFVPEQSREALAQRLVVVDEHELRHGHGPYPGRFAPQSLGSGTVGRDMQAIAPTVTRSTPALHRNTAKSCPILLREAGGAEAVLSSQAMAKATEKLIRQLSLISYLMAERRPVTALEIRRDVEGYSGMNEDAFARRFYADRAELDALGIVLSVEK